MTLKSPPRFVIFFCLLVFGFAELAGSVLGGSLSPGAIPLLGIRPQEQIRGFLAGLIRANPDVHGLVGVEDIDRTIVEKAVTEVLSRVHTFHLHGHGMGIVVFLVTLVIANSSMPQKIQTFLSLISCLGLLYPFGWLAVAITVPFLAKSGAMSLAEALFFIPFGGLFTLAVWIVIFFYFREIVNPLAGGGVSHKGDALLKEGDR